MTPQIKTRFPQSSLATCLLPWTENYELDTDVFQRHVQRAIELGYTDIYLMGTAGEGYALSDRQFQQVVQQFARQMSLPNLRPQVGVISLSMRQIIERIEFCRDLGIRMFQLSLPSWGALSDPELMAFFRGVCSRFPDCRFLHYNLPRAKRILRGADYRRIMDEVPNLVATKNSTTDCARVADLMRMVPDLQHFFTESSFAFGCLWGECSLLSSYGLLFPKVTRRFYEAGLRKDLPVLWELHRQLNDLDKVLFGHLESDYIDGAYDKTFAWLADPGFPNRLLPPYQGLSDDETRKVREAYSKHCGHLS